MFQDTIAAIANADAMGAISVIRISGSDAIQIVTDLTGKDFSEAKGYTIHYATIKEGNESVDEVLVSLFRAPKSYTGEDVVEISCHGGVYITRKVLSLILGAGARMARRGEFTERAFLNGKMDLSQAEGINDLIWAKDEINAKSAIHSLKGSVAKLMRPLEEDLTQIISNIEVNIDYPEYDDVEEMTLQLLREKTQQVSQGIRALLNTASQGKILRDGLKTAIVGRPNVGKSSLLNVLLREEKAIVTDIAGTTRDTIEEYVNVRGVPLQLIDTAGIRETDDVVERIGVERSRKALNEADFVLLILNQSEELMDEDLRLLEQTKDFKRIILLNKTDLPTKIDMDKVKEFATDSEIVTTSMLKKEGIDQLEEKIADYFFQGQMNERDATYLSNTRHIALLEKAEQALQEVANGVDMGMPVDLIQIDFTRAWDLLGEITGDTVQDELLTQLFSQFCLGK